MGFEWTFASLSFSFCGFEIAEGAAGEDPRRPKCILWVVFGWFCVRNEIQFSTVDTPRVGESVAAVVWPVVDRYQDVSTRALLLCISSSICRAVSLSMTVMGPPQCGQTQRAGGFAVIFDGAEIGRAPVASSCWQSGNVAARRRLARKSKKRMRMKPRGSVCSRKRRKNSSAVSVISRRLLPCA